MTLLATLLVCANMAQAACPDVRDCQHRAATWEDGAWVGVGMGWGTTALTAVGSSAEHPGTLVTASAAYGSFALSIPLMAAAASPSKRAVALSSNELRMELRRRPRWWMVYGLGLAFGAGSLGVAVSDRSAWWVHSGLGVTAAGLFTASAAGFTHDSRWIRRQAPINSHIKRRRAMLVPTGRGLALWGRF